MFIRALLASSGNQIQQVTRYAVSTQRRTLSIETNVHSVERLVSSSVKEIQHVYTVSVVHKDVSFI